MSAFDRHPLRAQYEDAARTMPPKNALEIMSAQIRLAEGEKVRVPAPRYLSAQNRRVRFAVDTDLARAKDHPNNGSRQQRRFAARKGFRYEARGPEEV